MKEFFKRTAALVLCTALLCPAARAEEAVYTDVPAGAWYEQAVEYCRVSGLMQGTDPGLFSPDQTVSRAMLAVALHRLAGSPAGSPADYADVPADAWYAAEVGWAKTAGIMQGYGDGSVFGPEDPVTRE